MVNAVGTDPISSWSITASMLNSKETSPPEIDLKCSPSEKLIREWISDYCYSLTTNLTKTQRCDTVTGAKNTDGSGILDEPSPTNGSKPVQIIEGVPLGKVDGILQERGARYGNFYDHASICQQLKYVISDALVTRDKRDGMLLMPDQQQALDVICDKIARILNGDPDYVDNWDDIAGYATLVSKRLTADKDVQF